MGTYICGEGNIEGKGGEVHGGAASIGECERGASAVNATLNKVGRQRAELVRETRWIERHDSVLLFCAEISNIAEALHMYPDGRITTLPAKPTD